MEYAELVEGSRPEALRASLAANADELQTAAHGHHHGDGSSTRTETYKGHRIVIRTTYEITVDDQPFDAAVIVDNAGRVYYHGLPTRDFGSTVDLVKKVIDLFPADFVTPDEGHHPEHGGH